MIIIIYYIELIELLHILFYIGTELYDLNLVRLEKVSVMYHQTNMLGSDENIFLNWDFKLCSHSINLE